MEDVNAMREIKKGMDSAKDDNPNMAEIAAKAVFKSVQAAAGVPIRCRATPSPRRRRRAWRP